MLRIKQQSSSAAAKSYYSTADYFTEGQELAGIWRGKGAAALGLSGIVQQKDWDHLCENLHPQTGEQLTARQNDNRRVGWDFNFSVPKSISLVYALTKDQRILDAFSESVDQTMADIESELQTRVRIHGQDTDRTTGNGVWGRFVHFTSRPVDGIPDPQLHAHCFLFNTTYDIEESRWKAAQIANIKRDGNYFSALMHSRLAWKLNQLGLPIERTAKGWRIEGFDVKTEGKFSRRTKQIDKLAEKLGITDPEEKAELGAMTRDGKVKELSFDELRATWLSWLSPDESDTLVKLQQDMNSRESGEYPSSPAPSIARDALDYAAEHHFERESVIPERVMLTTALHHSIGAARHDEILDTIYKGGLIRGEQNGRRMVTSEAVLDEERKMLTFARNGLNSFDPLATGNLIEPEKPLYEDQRQALKHLCASRDRVMLLRGIAGTGKSTMLKALKANIEAHGKKTFAFAPSSTASRDVLRNEGFEDAETVAHLLASSQAQADIQDQVILIDEAGLLGTRTMANVFDIAERANARVILSGDSRQHRSVERGAALRLLEKEAGIRSAQLTQIIRQKDRYLQAMAYLSQGRVEAGFRTLDDLHWIHEIADSTQRYETIAAEYLQATEAGKSVRVISPTHAEGDRVTSAIRKTLLNEKKIGGNISSLLKLTSRKLTTAQKTDSVNYVDGDVVVFTQNAKGIRKGTRLTVGKDAIPLALSERFEVFHASQMEVTEGDLIRITANGSSADGHSVRNGQVYSVQKIAKDGTLKLNNGWHLGKEFGSVDFGYCSTSHSAQGKTVDKVIIAEATESFPAASCEQIYVSASRGRSMCSIYTDDKAALLEAVSNSSDAMSATELAATRKPILTLQRRVAMQMAMEQKTSREPTIQHERSGL